MRAREYTKKEEKKEEKKEKSPPNELTPLVERTPEVPEARSLESTKAMIATLCQDFVNWTLGGTKSASTPTPVVTSASESSTADETKKLFEKFQQELLQEYKKDFPSSRAANEVKESYFMDTFSDEEIEITSSEENDNEIEAQSSEAENNSPSINRRC